ncbi:MAG: PRC-barrel domain-containing protein [Rhodomicrobiaceae bacterium]
MLKKLTLTVATAALMTSGAFAQDNNQPVDQTTTPPAASQPADQPSMDAAPDTTTAPDMSTDTADTPAMTEPGSTAGVATTDLSSEFVTSASAGHMRVSELTGLTVRNSADENLGDINDIILGNQGEADVAIIGVGGFLGIGEKNVGVPFDRINVTVGENNNLVARLDTTKEALEAAPAYVDRDDQTSAVTPAPATDAPAMDAPAGQTN